MTTQEILQVALGTIGSMALYIGSRISQDLHKLTQSVERLNERMATIIERVDSHEKRISKIEEKV